DDSIPTTAAKRKIEHINAYDDLDGYETPEEVEHFAKYVKHMAILAGQARRKVPVVDNSVNTAFPNGDLLPLPVSRLLTVGATYELDVLCATDDERMLSTYAHDTKSIDAVITKYATRYIESIVIFGSYWFFITSVDAFMHHRACLDDCADNSMALFEDKSVATIKVKTNRGWEYYEFSIRIGDLELLATGGFWGSITTDERRPFLGSSIPNLPASMRRAAAAKAIYIPSSPVPHTRTNRLLRQYGKISAGWCWAFHSRSCDI
ncbi:hypothetical protein DFQ30_004810, partial [Apophysomyces sp. BC1015]